MKPLSESLLFFGMRQATEKKLSEMTKSEQAAWIAQLDPHEKYYFEERVAIDCEGCELKPHHLDAGQDAVIKARIKLAIERDSE